MNPEKLIGRLPGVIKSIRKAEVGVKVRAYAAPRSLVLTSAPLKQKVTTKKLARPPGAEGSWGGL